jgi:HlyD family secretion protein
MKQGTRLPVLGLVAALALSAAGCSGSGESQEIQKSTDKAPVERRDLEIRAEASGQIEPLRVVEVKSRVAGELRRITVETGDEIRQGELIAEIDPRDVRNAFEQAEADVGVARAEVTTATTQRKRVENLAKAGVVSLQDLESSQLAETNARAQLLKAETNLRLAREKTGDVTIRAPITGTVIEKTVEQGQIIASASGNVSGGTTLIKMADLGSVQARALIDEVDIGRIAPGQPASVTVEAYPGRTFRGKVTKIEPQAVVEQNVTMFPVLVRLENPERLLKTGMNAEVSVDIANRTDVVAVPNGAVVSPREAATAGAVLGLNEDEIRSQMAAMRGRRGGGGPGGQGAPAAEGAAAAQNTRGGRDGAEAGAAGGEQRRGPRAATEGMRNPEMAGSQASGATGGAPVDPTAGARPGVVFVDGAKGPEPRFVMLGLSDWDYTEVVRGLEPGEQVYLLSVARLQQQQQEQTNRMQQRAGGGMFGGGQQRGGSQGGSSQGGGGQGGGAQGGGPRGGGQ